MVQKQIPMCECCLTNIVESGSSVGRMPDSQSREPGFESPLLPFRSLSGPTDWIQRYIKPYLYLFFTFTNSTYTNTINSNSGIFLAILGCVSCSAFQNTVCFYLSQTSVILYILSPNFPRKLKSSRPYSI